MYLLKISIIFLSIFGTIAAMRPPKLQLKTHRNKTFEYIPRGYIFEQEFAKEDSETYRLPNNSRPVRYDLWIKTDVDKEIFGFFGRVKIHIKIIESTQKITVHARQLNIQKIDLLKLDNQSVLKEGLDYTYNNKFEFLVINLPELQEKDSKVLLEISYNGVLREDQSGFYRASYLDVNGTRNWFATTQFEPIDARHVMPCYDEPGIRAVIGVQVQHAKSYMALSNMPLLNDPEPVPETDYVVSKFEDTVQMQTYLLALIISNYDYASNNDEKPEQRVYARPEVIANGEVSFAKSQIGPILRKFEDVLEVKFPLPKLDHTLVADFQYGGMENFGLIVYREIFLINSEDELSDIDQVVLLSHEIAHQWFGNIVGPSWWSYAWLNEGFSALLANYIPSLLFPDKGYMQDFVVNRVNTAFEIDVGDSVPLNYYVETPDNQRWVDVNSIPAIK